MDQTAPDRFTDGELIQYRVADPNLIVGVWIAFDSTTKHNGCMELVPTAHWYRGALPCPVVPLDPYD